jgi:hypothetical protein
LRLDARKVLILALERVERLRNGFLQRRVAANDGLRAQPVCRRASRQRPRRGARRRTPHDDAADKSK